MGKIFEGHVIEIERTENTCEVGILLVGGGVNFSHWPSWAFEIASIAFNTKKKLTIELVEGAQDLKGASIKKISLRDELPDQ